MALVPYRLGDAANGQVAINLHYDDVTLLINDVTVTDSYGLGVLTLTLLSKGLAGQPPRDTVMFGPKAYPTQIGTTVDDLTPFGAHMIHDVGTNRRGPYDVIVPPVGYTLEWSG